MMISVAGTRQHAGAILDRPGLCPGFLVKEVPGLYKAPPPHRSCPGRRRWSLVDLLLPPTGLSNPPTGLRNKACRHRFLPIIPNSESPDLWSDATSLHPTTRNREALRSEHTER